MPAPIPPERNKHDREIWFKDNGDGYGLAHRNGCIMYLLGFAWILFSAPVGIALFLQSNHLGAFIIPFVMVTPGLLLMAVTVRRHS